MVNSFAVYYVIVIPLEGIMTGLYTDLNLIHELQICNSDVTCKNTILFAKNEQYFALRENE
jgi:hypothetical protein